MSKKENNKDELLPINELGVEQLRFYCEEECLDFQTTATVPPLEGIIGQERAVKAMDFGLHTKNTRLIMLGSDLDIIVKCQGLTPLNGLFWFAREQFSWLNYFQV